MSRLPHPVAALTGTAVPIAELSLVGGLVRVRPAAITLASVRSAPTDELVVVGAWAVALAVASWLLVATLACVVACRPARTPTASVLARCAPTLIRRLVEAAFATSVVVGPVGPAVATQPAPLLPRHVPSGGVIVDEPVVRTPAAPVPTTVATAPPVDEATPVPPPTPATYVVANGDNLWAIARARLESVGAGADVDSVARYWRTLVDANRTTLRSGNPNLIYPGEVVNLPPTALG